jgi:hypothetical protein
MATFPTLTPSSRTFTPGRHPHSEIPTLDGLQVRVRTSNVILEQQLRLTFLGLTEAQMLSIRSHYIGQQGRFLSFAIPSSLLSGMTTPSYFTPTGYSWIYGSAPQVEDIPCAQRYNVSVELVTVPPEGANINGAEFTVSIDLTAGLAVAAANATGANLTVTASITGGVVADNTSSGLDISVTSSLVAGAADGGAPTNDPNWANVKLMLGCNSLPATDESSFATPIGTNTTAPLLDTSVKKFDAASFSFPGDINRDLEIASTNDNLDVAASTAFTWECWFYLISIDTNATGWGNTNAFMESQGASDYVTGVSRASSGAVPQFFFIPLNGTTGGFYHQSTVPLSTWVHWALVRDTSNNIYIYQDGVKSTSSVTSSLALDNSSTVGFTIGKRQSASNYNLRMDEVRITVGTARYTADFTPPTTAFPRS